MLIFYILRHGQTENNVKGILQGHNDSPLTKKGIEETNKISKELEKEKIDFIISSDLGRAIQTANIIAQPKNTTLLTTTQLREIDFGDLNGKQKKSYKELTEEEKRTNYVFPNGESYDVLFTRVTTYIENLKEHYENRNVVLIAHGGVIRCLESYFNNIPLQEVHGKVIPHERVWKVEVENNNN